MYTVKMVASAMQPVVVQPQPVAVQPSYNQFQQVQVAQPAAMQVQQVMRSASLQMQAAVNQARQAMAKASVGPRLVTPMPLSFNLQRNMGYAAAAPQRVCACEKRECIHSLTRIFDVFTKVCVVG